MYHDYSILLNILCKDNHVTFYNSENSCTVIHYFSDEQTDIVNTVLHLMRYTPESKSQLCITTNNIVTQNKKPNTMFDFIGIGYGTITILDTYRSLSSSQQQQIKSIILINPIIDSNRYIDISNKVKIETISDNLFSMVSRITYETSNTVLYSLDTINKHARMLEQYVEKIIGSPLLHEHTILHNESANTIISFLTHTTEMENIVMKTRYSNEMFQVYHDNVNNICYLVHYVENKDYECLLAMLYLICDVQPNANKTLEINTTRILQALHDELPDETSYVLMGVGYGSLTMTQTYATMENSAKRSVKELLLVNPIVEPDSCLKDVVTIKRQQYNNVHTITLFDTWMAVIFEVLSLKKTFFIVEAHVDTTDYSDIIDIFHMKVVRKVEKYIEIINKGEYDKVKEYGVQEETEIVEAIEEVERLAKKKDLSPILMSRIRKYIDFIYDVAKSIRHVKEVYKNYLNEKVAREGNEKYGEILYNREKLNKFIEDELNNQDRILKGSFTISNPIIDPIYAEYIKRWGLPDKLIFDPKLLSSVRKEMECQ